MLNHFLFFPLSLHFFQLHFLFRGCQQFAGKLAAVFKQQFHRPPQVFQILAGKFERLIQSGGGYLQLKFTGRKEAGFFQLFVQGPVTGNAVTERNALVCIQQHLNFIAGFHLYVHQKVARLRCNQFFNVAGNALCFLLDVHGIERKKGTSPFPSAVSLSGANVRRRTVIMKFFLEAARTPVPGQLYQILHKRGC